MSDKKVGLIPYNRTDEDIIKTELGMGVIKGAISAVPIVGGFLNEALFDISARIKEERFKKVVQSLDLEVQSIKAEYIRKDLLLTEEYVELLEQVLSKSTKNKLHSNQEYLVKTLVLSMCDEDFLKSEYLKECVEIFANLNKPELILILAFKENALRQRSFKEANAKELDFKIDFSTGKYLNLTRPIFDLTFDSLISKGLVYDDSVGRYGGGRKEYIKPTEMLQIVYNYIEDLTKLQKYKDPHHTPS